MAACLHEPALLLDKPGRLPGLPGLGAVIGAAGEQTEGFGSVEIPKLAAAHALESWPGSLPSAHPGDGGLRARLRFVRYHELAGLRDEYPRAEFIRPAWEGLNGARFSESDKKRCRCQCGAQNDRHADPGVRGAFPRPKEPSSQSGDPRQTIAKRKTTCRRLGKTTASPG